jgi:predicted GIY-YIG superfamily endonuclease
MQFNILDYLSDDIGNIDLTKSYVYVLKLEDDRYYVGRTSNFMQRMKEHFTYGGSEYTKKYKPIKIVEVFEEKDTYDERDKTLEYMQKYGYEKVRGYAWCREVLLKFPKTKNKNKKTINKEKYCYNDEGIKKLYVDENKDIIEIGNILNKSPGSIAYILEKMNIVERRQLTRGYFDYVFSDLYDKYKRSNKKLYIKDDNENKDNMLKSTLTKDELNNVKMLIRERYNLGNGKSLTEGVS